MTPDTDDRSAGRNRLLHKFRTAAGCYAYDGATGRIVALSPSMYALLDVYYAHPREEAERLLSQSFPVQEAKRAYDCVDKLVNEHGVFAVSRLTQRMRPVTLEDTERELQRGVGHCTLEVTQSCNLRCEYCTYSGGYRTKRRHSARRMDHRTAEAAVRYVASRNADIGLPVSLGFYGGEPLLEYHLITHVANYAKRLCGEGRLRLNMTTNATLLDKDIARFLVENDVEVLVSLDGDRINHDRYRRSRTGTGTFDAVMENLARLREIAPDYYQKHVAFSATISPSTDLLTLEGFFSDGPDLVTGNRMRVSYVSPGNESFFRRCEAHPQREEQEAYLAQAFLDAHVQGHAAGKVATALFEKPILLLHRRSIASRGQREASFTATCFPLARKMYVAADGGLHICERIGMHIQVGRIAQDVEIDIERLTDLVNEYCGIMNQDDCLGCWAFRLCDCCYASVDDIGVFSEENKRARCAARIQRASLTLSAYCSALERNAHAWDSLDQVVLT